MTLKQLEALGKFERIPYDDSAVWELSSSSGCDWHVFDLFGDYPETVHLHAGTIEFDGNLDLDETEGDGYYVIDGSLLVRGVLKIEIDGEYNVIMITENLQADALVVAWETQLYVLGNTTINGPLLSELSDGGACYLNRKTIAEGIIDLGEVPPWLGSKPEVPKLEIHSRYSLENCQDQIGKMLKDLRAGKKIY